MKRTRSSGAAALPGQDCQSLNAGITSRKQTIPARVTASVLTPSSRTCCCILARVPVNIVLLTSMRSLMEVSISHTYHGGPRRKARSPRSRRPKIPFSLKIAFEEVGGLAPAKVQCDCLRRELGQGQAVLRSPSAVSPKKSPVREAGQVAPSLGRRQSNNVVDRVLFETGTPPVNRSDSLLHGG